MRLKIPGRFRSKCKAIMAKQAACLACAAPKWRAPGVDPFVTDRPPLGSWDKYEITAREGTVVVVLNGKKVNEGRNAVPSEGNICLQSEGWPVQYRNVAVKELD